MRLASCHSPAIPSAEARTGRPTGSTLAQAQQASIPVLDLRVNSLGVSEATVQAQGDDQILVQLPGVSLKDAIQTIGTTSRLYFATAIAGAATNPPSTAVISDQQGHYDVNQFPDTALYPRGFHWKVDDALDATDVHTATVVSDSNTGAVNVDITFHSTGAAA